MILNRPGSLETFEFEQLGPIQTQNESQRVSAYGTGEHSSSLALVISFVNGQSSKRDCTKRSSRKVCEANWPRYLMDALSLIR